MKNQKKVKIALICFDNPFLAPMEGGKRGMLGRIEALASNENYEVDVYLLSKPEEIDNKRYKYLESSNVIYKEFVINKASTVLFSSLPISVAKRYIKECRKELQNNSYDVAIYEGEHVSSYRLKNIVNANRHLLYMHDIESDYRRDLSKSETRKLISLAQRIESNKYRRLENRIHDLFDITMFVSVNEIEKYGERFPEKKDTFVYLPHVVGHISSNVANNSNHTEILYFGNMILDNNFRSIKWFVESVFPLIIQQRPDVKLKLIGNISQENKSYLLNCSENIEILGYVEDLEKEISDACLIVSPVLYGAGVKVKIIDALASGQIVITNSKTLEGTRLIPNVDVLVADDPDEFALKCCNVLEDREKFIQIASNGLEHIRNEHSLLYQIKILDSVINSEKL